MPAKPEDPQRYMSTYQSTLLSTEQLLAQIRELGITDDIVDILLLLLGVTSLARSISSSPYRSRP